MLAFLYKKQREKVNLFYTKDWPGSKTTSINGQNFAITFLISPRNSLGWRGLDLHIIVKYCYLLSRSGDFISKGNFFMKSTSHEPILNFPCICLNTPEDKKKQHAKPNTADIGNLGYLKVGGLGKLVEEIVMFRDHAPLSLARALQTTCTFTMFTRYFQI